MQPADGTPKSTLFHGASPYFNAPHCNLLHSSMLFGASVHVSILHCTLLYVATLHCTLLYVATLHCTLLYVATLHCTLLYVATLHCTLFYVATLNCTLLYVATLHCTLLYVAKLHCTLLYVATPHCTSPYLTLLQWSYASVYIAVLGHTPLCFTGLHCTLLCFALFYCSLLHLADFTSGTQPRGPYPSTGWRVTESLNQSTLAHWRATSARTWHTCKSGIAHFKARMRSSPDPLACALDASEIIQCRQLSVVIILALRLWCCAYHGGNVLGEFRFGGSFGAFLKNSSKTEHA